MTRPTPGSETEGETMTTTSRELADLIADRSETPELVGTGAGVDAPELYRFADGTEVVVTNAGLVTEDADGFADMRAAILS